MSHFPEDLRTLVLNSTAVTCIVSGRVHYNHIPEYSAKPHVWFRVSSDTEERTLDGAGGLHEAICDLECVGATETSAQSLGDAVKTQIDGYKGAAGNATCQGAFLRDKDDDYIPFANRSDEGAHVVAFTLTCWYTTC